MKARKKFTDEQKIKIVKRALAGERVEELCKELGVHNSVVYAWKQKFAKASKSVKAVKVSKIPNKGDFYILAVRDAAAWQRHASAAMYSELRAGKIKKFTKSQLMWLLSEAELAGDS